MQDYKRQKREAGGGKTGTRVRKHLWSASLSVEGSEMIEAPSEQLQQDGKMATIPDVKGANDMVVSDQLGLFALKEALACSAAEAETEAEAETDAADGVEEAQQQEAEYHRHLQHQDQQFEQTKRDFRHYQEHKCERELHEQWKRAQRKEWKHAQRHLQSQHQKAEQEKLEQEKRNQEKLEQEQAHEQLRKLYEVNLNATLLQVERLKPPVVRRSWSGGTEEAYAKFRQFGAGAEGGEGGGLSLTQLLHGLRRLSIRLDAGHEVYNLPQRLKGALEQMERRLGLGNSQGVSTGPTKVDADSELDYCIAVQTTVARMLAKNLARIKTMKDGSALANTIGAKLMRVLKEMKKLKEGPEKGEVAEGKKTRKKQKRSEEEERKARVILAYAAHVKKKAQAGEQGESEGGSASEAKGGHQSKKAEKGQRAVKAAVAKGELDQAWNELLSLCLQMPSGLLQDVEIALSLGAEPKNKPPPQVKKGKREYALPETPTFARETVVRERGAGLGFDMRQTMKSGKTLTLRPYQLAALERFVKETDTNTKPTLGGNKDSFGKGEVAGGGAAETVADPKQLAVTSGVISLPCGAGKTLVGIAACCKLGLPCCVLVNSTEVAQQWLREFARFTNAVDYKDVTVFSGKSKGFSPEATVWVLTYQVQCSSTLACPFFHLTDRSSHHLSYCRLQMAARAASDAHAKSDHTSAMAERLKKRSWGLCILDEVHSGGCAPFYRLACEAVGAPYRLGLSATLVREDGKIEELQESVGRLLFKTKAATKRISTSAASADGAGAGGAGAGAGAGGAATAGGPNYSLVRQSSLKMKFKPGGARDAENEGYGDGYGDDRGDKVPGVSVLELQAQGFLPRMSYIHVHCAMYSTKENPWAVHYHGSKGQKKQRLATLNPTKMMMLQFLLHYHFEMGDKVLIFCDETVSLRNLARHLQLPYMDGQTPKNEREALLHLFKGGSSTTSTSKLAIDEQRWCSILMLSRVGDKGIDLPDANVLIQIATHGKAREQEVQRLGRIGRQKLSGRAQEAGSIFYSLVSAHTNDVDNATHRAMYVEELMGIERKEVDSDKLPMAMRREQRFQHQQEQPAGSAAGSADDHQDLTLCRCLTAATTAALEHMNFYQSVALVGQPPVWQTHEDPTWPWVVQVQTAAQQAAAAAAAAKQKPALAARQKPKNAMFKKRARDNASQ
jgi:superfamily II DNA or RNA helicase